MVLLLNLIPLIAVVIACYLIYLAAKRRNVKLGVLTVVGFVLFFTIYTMALPSYTQKGTARTTLEQPELIIYDVEIPVENRLREAKIEENQQKFEERFDWRKRVEQNKQNTESDKKP